ncbi:MAG: hypothetical protein WKI04_10475 [Ferruginibacter sp.]
MKNIKQTIVMALIALSISSCGNADNNSTGNAGGADSISGANNSSARNDGNDTSTMTTSGYPDSGANIRAGGTSGRNDTITNSGGTLPSSSQRDSGRAGKQNSEQRSRTDTTN